MSVLNFMFELDGKDKTADVNKQIDDKEELDELKKLNRKEIVGSKFVNVNANSSDNLIEHNKLNNDPLYLLKKEQIHRRNKILLNEYKMKKIKRCVKEQKAKSKHRKHRKKRKKQRKKDRKLKKLLLKSLNHDGTDTDSDDGSSVSRHRSRSRSRSRERHHRRHKSDNHRHHRRHHRYRSRSRSRSRSPKKSTSEHNKKASKSYGLIYNDNTVCGVKMDRKTVNEIKQKRNTSSNTNDKYGKRDQHVEQDDDALLRQMMDTADEYDKYRKERLNKYQKHTENETEEHKKDGAYLSQMANKLYMDHSDTLESRLNKSANHLLKRNTL
eukprot:55462_1